MCPAWHLLGVGSPGWPLAHVSGAPARTSEMAWEAGCGGSTGVSVWASDFAVGRVL